MHVGICLNCRYIDLMENVGTAPNAGAVCPRCGTEMSSLGVRTDEWNALSAKGKEKLIREKFPTHDELFGTKQDGPDGAEDTSEEIATPESFATPETGVTPETVAAAGSAEETEDLTSEEPPASEEARESNKEITGEESEEPPKTEDPPGPIDDEPEDSGETVNIKELFGEAATAGLDDFIGDDEESAQEREPDEYDLNRVYVCYKCNTIASHDGAQGRYYCYECGSDMVGTGYTIREWSDLSKEEKRKVTEDAKLMHMVSEIKRDDYGDGGPDHTPSIINVVKDPNKVY